MHKQVFIVFLCIFAIFIFLIPEQVSAENELVFVEKLMPVPEEVLEEIDFSEAITIQQVYEQIEWQIFDLVNQERQSLGKPALQMDSVLRDICRNHSKDYGDNNLEALYPDPKDPRRGHYSPNTGWPIDRLASRGYTLGVHYTAYAENYASNSGHSDPGTAAFNAWMNSEGHRNNIRDVNNHGLNYTGIGVYRASNGGYYFTQKFVTAPSPLSSVVTPPTAPPPTDPEPTAPSIPTLVSPANGSTVTGSGADSRITFQWNASSGADRYQMRLRSVGATTWQTSPNDIFNTHTIANNFPNDGRQYEWAIRAGNNSGQWSNWSSAWVFNNGTSTAPPPPATLPGTPSLTSPGHGQIVHGHSAVLNWAPVANATHYAVWVHNLTRDELVIFTPPMAGTSYTLSGLANNGDIYAWSVVASNALEGSWGVFATPIAFINGSNAALLPPTLVSPGHNTNVHETSVTFSWTAPVGATHYAIWVYNLTKDELGIFSDPTTSTSITLTGFLNNGDVYAWSVVASNIHNGTWSAFAFPRLLVNE